MLDDFRACSSSGAGTASASHRKQRVRKQLTTELQHRIVGSPEFLLCTHVTQLRHLISRSSSSGPRVQLQSGGGNPNIEIARCFWTQGSAACCLRVPEYPARGNATSVAISCWISHMLQYLNEILSHAWVLLELSFRPPLCVLDPIKVCWSWNCSLAASAYSGEPTLLPYFGPGANRAISGEEIIFQRSCLLALLIDSRYLVLLLLLQSCDLAHFILNRMFLRLFRPNISPFTRSEHCSRSPAL